LAAGRIWTTAKKRYSNLFGMACLAFWDGMSWFAAFGRNWPSILAKLVHGYSRLLPSRAWHEENNRIAARAPISAASSVAQPNHLARSGDELSGP
jgi:hypothetical protein